MPLIKAMDDVIGENVDDFNGAWAKYREMTRSGIIGYTDGEIRTVHGELSYLLSHAEMNYGQAAANLASATVKVKVTKAKLLTLDYGDGAFNQRQAQVEGDDRYIEVFTKEGECEAECELWKAQVKACETAVELLSREITARLKK